jgi:hypothetical protein
MLSQSSAFLPAVLATLVAVAVTGCTPTFIPANRVDFDGDGYFAPGSVDDLIGMAGSEMDIAKLDCDDTRDEVFPLAAELCDGVDNDCDRTVIEECAGQLNDCQLSLDPTERDDDGDGFTECGFNPETGEVSGAERDCNDDSEQWGEYMNPGRTEICAMPPVEGLAETCIEDLFRPEFGLDDDCDGVRMEGERDQDRDGYAQGCELVNIDGTGDPLLVDCDDTDPLTNPAIGIAGSACATLEIQCVGGEEDYSATNCTDQEIDQKPWYPNCDLDGDGSEDEDSWLLLCSNETPLGYATNPVTDELVPCAYNGLPPDAGANWINSLVSLDLNTDCNDDDNRFNGLDADDDGFSTCEFDYYPTLVSADGEPYAYPGACEMCDGIDNDLDGDVDEGYDQDSDSAYFDYSLAELGGCADNPYGAVKDCEQELPAGYDNAYLESQMDCDDSDPTQNTQDLDQDGVSTCAGDCNDGDPNVSNTDFDSDGFTTCMVPPDCDDTDPTLKPEDVDGDGFTSCQGDCLDEVAAPGPNVYPGNGVQCDGFWDTDCDGITDPLEADADNDAWDSNLDGIFEWSGTECGSATEEGDCDDTNPGLNGRDEDADGWSTCAGDCDDNDDTVFPGAPNLCDDGVLDNDCNGVPDPNEADQDNDGNTLCDTEPDCNDFDDSVETLDLDGDGSTTCDGDCEDNNSSVTHDTDVDGDGWTYCPQPGHEADCDDAEPDLNWSDVDGDASTTCSPVADCDDFDPALNQQDADGDGETTCPSPTPPDCNDFSILQKTTGNEGSSSAQADGLDNDCDGTADEGLIFEGDLAITEILVAAAPPTGDGPAEYVEVINASGHDIDLRGWVVEVDDLGIPATTEFTFPSGVDEEPLFIADGERAVLARPSNATVYGYDIADYHWSAAAFSDVGGSITLSFGTSDVDVVTWMSTGCASACDDPTNPNYVGPAYWRPGYAMGLKEVFVLGATPDDDNNDANNWCEQRDSLGPVHGSPGAAPAVLGDCG